jgi:hypothetical protein
MTGFPILALHVGHRLSARDDKTLRCHDCDHTLNLTVPARAGSTSTSRSLPNLNDPASCEQHPGEWAQTCGRCRSEQLGTDEPRPVQARGADPLLNDAWQAARAALTNKSRTTTEETS